MKLSSIRSFTLTEILIVAIIIAILAGFVVPNYTNYREQSKEKLGYNNLQIIYRGLDLYYLQNNSYPAGSLDLAAINAALGIALIPGDLTYSCTNTATTFSCTTGNSTWTMHISSSHKSNLVHCSTGVCPKCSYDEAIGCPY